jgi:hypothetical protein
MVIFSVSAFHQNKIRQDARSFMYGLLIVCICKGTFSFDGSGVSAQIKAMILFINRICSDLHYGSYTFKDTTNILQNQQKAYTIKGGKRVSFSWQPNLHRNILHTAHAWL